MSGLSELHRGQHQEQHREQGLKLQDKGQFQELHQSNQVIKIAMKDAPKAELKSLKVEKVRLSLPSS